MPGATLDLDPDGPAMAPPDGQISDFVHGGSHEMIEAVLPVCIALAALSVLFRVWSRLSMKPRLFGIEDGLLLCALVSKDLSLLYPNIFPGEKADMPVASFRAPFPASSTLAIRLPYFLECSSTSGISG